MATRIIEIALDDTRSVVAEVADADSGLAPISRPSQWAADAAKGTVESALRSTVVPLAELIFHEMQQMKRPPQEVTLEFGLKLNGQVGVAIAGVRMESSILVKLSWPADTANPV